MLTVLLSFWFNSVNNEGVLSLFTLFFWFAFVLVLGFFLTNMEDFGTLG